MTDWDVMRTGRTVCAAADKGVPLDRRPPIFHDYPTDLASKSPNHQVGVEAAKQTDITEDCGGKVEKDML